MLHAEKAQKIDAILAANPPVLPAPEPVDVPVKSNVAFSVVKPVRTDVLIVHDERSPMNAPTSTDSDSRWR
ncbi:MAG: hypothetical protein JWR85_3419 [Marmoricola sp.]|nr:hypothetical protein [Marmoricola sp.]